MLDPRRDRPSHRAGEPRDQRDPGDRTPRFAPIEPGQRREGRVVEPHCHADAEHNPGGRQSDHALRQPEQREAGGQHDIRGDQHGAPAMPVDQRSDIGRSRRGQQQRRREQAEKQGRRNAKRRRDRRAQYCRQIKARRPGQRLRRPEPGDDECPMPVQRPLPASFDLPERAKIIPVAARRIRR